MTTRGRKNIKYKRRIVSFTYPVLRLLTWGRLQGRVDDNFDDQAEGLLTRLQEVQPDAASMEMESFMLLDLARCSKGTVKAAATAIVVANRPTGGVVDGTTLLHVESMGGKAVLQALASHPL